MSLHTLANHLQTAGRGEDKVLVHMTPGEVNGLQSLAMAHGGSLTVNPETGLPEAGFLSAILPMVASAAATAMGVPISPMQMAAATTVIGTATSGSLMKGLQMGMGAYGGASLAQGFMGPTGAEGAMSAPISSADAALRAGQNIGGAFAANAAAPAAASTWSGVTPNFANAAQTAGTLNPTADAIARATGTTAAPPLAPAMPNPVTTMNQGQAAYADYMARNPTPVVASNLPTSTPGATSVENATMFDKLKSLPGKAWDMLGSGPDAEKNRKEFFDKYKIPLAASGLSALMLSREEQKAPKETSNYQTINPAYYSYMQNRPGAAFADGGFVNQPVEQMSQENSVGANTNYPMANSKPYGYAVPKNYPISQNVFQPESYERVDPYTGEQKFGGGGPIKKPAAPASSGGGGLGSIFGQKSTAPSTPTGIGSIVAAAAKAPAAKAAPAASTPKPVTPAPKQAPAAAVSKPAEKNTSLQYGSTIKPQVNTRPAVPEKKGTYTPNLVVDEKGNYVATKDLPPVTEFKKFGSTKEAVNYLYDNKTKKTVEPEDVKAHFQDALRRDPTEEEIDALVGKPMTSMQIVKFAQSRPDFKAKASFTDDDIKDNFKYYIGKEPTAGELKSIKNSNPDSWAKLQSVIVNRPAYLDNVNKIAENKFTEQQKTEADTQAEAEKQATSMKVDDVFKVFSNVYGRSPDRNELNQYTGAHETLDSLTAKLKGTDEYLNKLAEGSKGVTYTADTGKTATSFTPATTTGTTAGTTAANTGVAGATGAAGTSGVSGATTGAATGLSGLQDPTGRGTINVPGAFPITPDWFNSQLGIQNLASLAAQKAAPLQGGLDFGLPTTTANQFGFDPTLATPEQLQAEMLRRAQLSGYGATGNTTGTTVTSALGMATGGIAGYNLGGYSDGGRLLRGPGDGVSDSIPASIGDRQPARLADGEFVIPARIVSELGNGSTDAGARKLYAMMNRVQQARRRTVGKNKVAVKSGADKMLPA